MDDRLQATIEKIEKSVFEYANGFIEDFNGPDGWDISRRILALAEPPSLGFLIDSVFEARTYLLDPEDPDEDALDFLFSEIESEVRSLSDRSSFSLSGWKSELRDILKE